MLARLTASQVELSEMPLGDECFSFDMENFRLVVPVPDITWGRVAQMCERAMNPMYPMYKGLYSVLEKDMEHVAHILAALEPDSELIQAPPNMLSGKMADDVSNAGTSNGALWPDPLIIRSPNRSIPTIVITPCPHQPRETSCQVPYQDSAFHNQLTVPSLPSFNQTFPPMMPPRRVSARGINWVWKNGHWQAALKGLEPRPRILKNRKKSRHGPIKTVQG